MNLLFKYATRSRPHLFFRGLENIVSTVKQCDYEVLVTYDSDDKSMQDEYFQLKLRPFHIFHDRITFVGGESKNKIEAINRGMDKVRKDWDILINFSDDMFFQYPGWDIDMIKMIREVWPTGTDFFAHFNDGFTGNAIPSMSIIGREYYSRFGYIYEPSYKSLWADNHAMQQAILLGKHHYFDYVFFKHLHPANTSIPQDNLYKFNESFYLEDEINYKNWKEKNFGIDAAQN